MGTHPIFESDFDCLTDFGLKNNSKKMSTHLQWAIINQFNSADIKKAGSIWSKEKGHLKGKSHSNTALLLTQETSQYLLMLKVELLCLQLDTKKAIPQLKMCQMSQLKRMPA